MSSQFKREVLAHMEHQSKLMLLIARHTVNNSNSTTADQCNYLNYTAAKELETLLDNIRSDCDY